jgi:hypothetical protein
MTLLRYATLKKKQDLNISLAELLVANSEYESAIGPTHVAVT